LMTRKKGLKHLRGSLCRFKARVLSLTLIL
jgi:hypothetical protein